MTLNELLSYYECQSGDIAGCIRKTRAFINLLKSIDRPEYGLNSLFDLFEYYGNRYPSPTEFKQIVTSLGVDLNVGVQKFVEAFSYLSGIGFTFNNLVPRYHDLYSVFQNSLEKIPSNELRNYLKSLPIVSRAGRNNIHLFDREYLVPKSKSVVEAIVSYFHGDELQYVSERLDCDDFARMFKGFLSRSGIGNLSAALVVGEFVYPEGDKVYHAINLIVYKEGNSTKYLLYEPQSEATFYQVGLNLKSVRLDFLMV